MYQHFFKRIFDIFIALIGVCIFFILLLFLAPIIYFTDKGPIFYNANRIGLDGKIFKMYKFRSMYVNAPDIRNEDGSTYNSDDDFRVTKIGRIMRKTSLDEFPQFLNVLVGDMSVIGPRPDPPDDIHIYTQEQKFKLTVKPGITGYNQAYFRNSISQNEKFANDVYFTTLTFEQIIRTLIAGVSKFYVYVGNYSQLKDKIKYGDYIFKEVLKEEMLTYVSNPEKGKKVYSRHLSLNKY